MSDFLYSHCLSAWYGMKNVRKNSDVVSHQNYFKGVIIENFEIWDTGVWSFKVLSNSRHCKYLKDSIIIIERDDWVRVLAGAGLKCVTAPIRTCSQIILTSRTTAAVYEKYGKVYP